MRAGATPKQTQIWMGHHSAAFTMTTYAHLLPDDLPDGDILDRFVNNLAATTAPLEPADTNGTAAVLDLPKNR